MRRYEPLVRPLSSPSSLRLTRLSHTAKSARAVLPAVRHARVRRDGALPRPRAGPDEARARGAQELSLHAELLVGLGDGDEPHGRPATVLCLAGLGRPE